MTFDCQKSSHAVEYWNIGSFDAAPRQFYIPEGVQLKQGSSVGAFNPDVQRLSVHSHQVHC